MGNLSSKIFFLKNKYNSNLTTPLNKQIYQEEVINDISSTSNKQIYQGELVNDNIKNISSTHDENLNLCIQKLQDLIKAHFKPKNNVYYEWTNLYLWNKECNIKKQLPLFYTFHEIFSSEFINDKNITISLILYEYTQFYFIFKYTVFGWGNDFLTIYNNNNFTYKIVGVQEFDNVIIYFNNIGFKTINSLKPLRYLLEDEYSTVYL